MKFQESKASAVNPQIRGGHSLKMKMKGGVKTSSPEPGVMIRQSSRMEM